MEYANLIVETEGALLTLTLNRPKALNALDARTLEELDAALSAPMPETRAIILTGAGEKAFVAGADISQMRGMTPSQARAYSETGHRVVAKLEALPAVTVAAVNGFALGGGLELAMGCDLLYASENAKLGQPEVNLGLMPGFGGTQRLQRLVGPMLAREMIFTGDPLDAATAKARGLVCDVFPRAELLPKVKEIARRIASRGPLAVAAAKRTIRRGADLGLDAANALEQASFALLFDTADTREGLAAFLEKRPAAFKGA